MFFQQRTRTRGKLTLYSSNSSSSQSSLSGEWLSSRVPSYALRISTAFNALQRENKLVLHLHKKWGDFNHWNGEKIINNHLMPYDDKFVFPRSSKFLYEHLDSFP